MTREPWRKSSPRESVTTETFLRLERPVPPNTQHLLLVYYQFLSAQLLKKGVCEGSPSL